MKRRTDESFILSGPVGGKAMGKARGKGEGALRLELAPAAEPVEFALLDCFDQPLCQSGRVLIEAGGRLILLTAAGACCEQEAARQGNFVSDLAPGPVREALRDLSPLRSLLALGRGRMVERRAALLDDEDKTRARAVLRRLEAEGCDACATLVELRHLRGYDSAYDQLARRVKGAGPRVEAGALCSLLFPGAGGYDPKPEVPILPDDPVLSAANAIIAAHIAVARRNEPGIIADLDTEFLHDYRVSLRKVRSVLSLFRGVYAEAQTAALKQAFSDLMAPTGRLRDLDVYLMERPVYFELLPEGLHDGLTAMFDIFARERAAELGRLTRRFRSAAYAEQIGRLQTLFDNPDRLAPGPDATLPALDYATALIWKRYRKVCKIACDIGEDTPDSDIHQLRIGCKKLRYLMEFFAPLFPGKAMKKLIKPLKRLQDNLGRFNDYSVQQASLRAFLESHRAEDRATDLAIAQSVGALVALLHQRQLEERARVVENFAHFDSSAVQKRFRDLFHEKATS